jgi:N-acylneuraminate cytidylyltransferase
MQERVLAIIPARGGSKGIPKKNVRLLAGKPLLAWSIEHARQTPAITRVIVSTDDPEIGAVAEQWGAEVVWRPPEISGDTASSESALLHVLDVLKEQEAFEPDLVVFLQATSPLRQPNDIQNAIEILQREQADSLFSAARVEGFTWRVAPDLVAPFTYDPVKRPRRQELMEEVVEENGSIYVFKPWVLRKFQSRLGGKIATSRMARLDSFQLDVPEDLPLLEGLLAARACTPDWTALAAVRLLVFDFDGVMTDNRVLVHQDGTEAVFCHRGDGWGLGRLKKTGLEILVLSTEKNPVVAARCHKLGLDCVQGCEEKLSVLRALAQARGLTPRQVAYVGNDLNDLDCLRWSGVSIVVADALPEVRAVARLVTAKPGGDGAVREVADWFLRARTGQAGRE